MYEPLKPLYDSIRVEAAMHGLTSHLDRGSKNEIYVWGTWSDPGASRGIRIDQPHRGMIAAHVHLLASEPPVYYGEHRALTNEGLGPAWSGPKYFFFLQSSDTIPRIIQAITTCGLAWIEKGSSGEATVCMKCPHQLACLANNNQA